jgi:hypothetical protein
MNLKTRMLAVPLCLIAVPAMAAGPERIRGHIVSAVGNKLTVKTEGGVLRVLRMNGDTAYVLAEPATRADVHSGSYIGTATKSVGGKLVALEVTIFPASMQGAGEGHYAWDRLPDTTTLGAGAVTQAAPVRTTKSSMTNGNVTASTDLPGAVTASGDKEITVAYKAGAQSVLLPPTAPVNKIEPADSAAVVPGAQVFIVAEQGAGGLMADYIVVAAKGARLAM